MSEIPLYYPTSAGGGVQPVNHIPLATFKGVGGVIEHPWQRTGLLGPGATQIIGVMAAADLSPGLSGNLPAARVVLPLPPVVQVTGNPSLDPKFMV